MTIAQNFPVPNLWECITSLFCQAADAGIQMIRNNLIEVTVYSIFFIYFWTISFSRMHLFLSFDCLHVWYVLAITDVAPLHMMADR